MSMRFSENGVFESNNVSNENYPFYSFDLTIARLSSFAALKKNYSGLKVYSIFTTGLKRTNTKNATKELVSVLKFTL